MNIHLAREKRKFRSRKDRERKRRRKREGDPTTGTRIENFLGLNWDLVRLAEDCVRFKLEMSHFKCAILSKKSEVPAIFFSDFYFTLNLFFFVLLTLHL